MNYKKIEVPIGRCSALLNSEEEKAKRDNLKQKLLKRRIEVYEDMEVFSGPLLAKKLMGKYHHLRANMLKWIIFITSDTSLLLRIKKCRINIKLK